MSIELRSRLFVLGAGSNRRPIGRAPRTPDHL